MLTVHHLEQSRSLRVLWLLEELETDYDLRLYDRAKSTRLAPKDFRALHPVGRAPIITDDDLTLAETGAIVEYIIDTYSDGKLRPRRNAAGRNAYLYWMHAAEGTLASLIVLNMFMTVLETRPPFILRGPIRLATGGLRKLYLNEALQDVFAHTEQTLSENTWIAGPKMTAADIMMSFPVEGVLADSTRARQFPHMQGYLNQIHERPAFRRAVEKGGALSLGI